jgi:hypothetical protein
MVTSSDLHHVFRMGQLLADHSSGRNAKNPANPAKRIAGRSKGASRMPLRAALRVLLQLLSALFGVPFPWLDDENVQDQSWWHE